MDMIQYSRLSSEHMQVNEPESWGEGFLALPDIITLNKLPDTATKVHYMWTHNFLPLTEQEESMEDVWNAPPARVSSVEGVSQIDREECEALFRYGAYSPTLIAEFFFDKKGVSLHGGTISCWWRGVGRMKPSVDSTAYERAPQSILEYREFLDRQLEKSRIPPIRRAVIRKDIKRVDAIMSFAMCDRILRVCRIPSTACEVLFKYGGARSRWLIAAFFQSEGCKLGGITFERCWKGTKLTAPCLKYKGKRQLILEYHAFLDRQGQLPERVSRAERNDIENEIEGVGRYLSNFASIESQQGLRC